MVLLLQGLFLLRKDEWNRSIKCIVSLNLLCGLPPKEKKITHALNDISFLHFSPHAVAGFGCGEL